MKKIINVVIILLLVVMIGGLGFSIFRHKDNNNNNDVGVESSVDFSTLTYTALGDSITWGSYQGKQMEKPYSVLVGEELGLLQVNNLGVGGASLSTGKPYATIVTQASSIPLETDIISVMGGTNDFGKNRPLGSITDTGTTSVYGGLKTIAQCIKNFHPNAFVFFMTALPLGDAKLEQYADSDITIEEINIATKKVAKMFDIPVLDTYALANFESEMNNTAISDGCHPTPEFHKNNLTPLVAQFIKDNYKK